MKTCRACLQSKADTEFFVRPKNAGGLSHDCRECMREIARKDMQRRQLELTQRKAERERQNLIRGSE